MLEVCNFNLGMDSLLNLVNNSMKYFSVSLEVFEFNIGKVLSLRCVSSQQVISCGECEICFLSDRMKNVKEFFFKMGDYFRKRFMLGLMRRFYSVDLLYQMVSLLQLLFCKDFIYFRSRVVSSLDTDMIIFSSDRVMDLMEVERFITGIWMWFQKVMYWIKVNFVLFLFQFCDSFLFYILSLQVRIFFIIEEKVMLIVVGKKFTVKF